MKKLLFCLLTIQVVLMGQDVKYTMPEEIGEHEGTWLQWPHDYTYGTGWRDQVEDSWVEMTKALVEGERVHIIAYDQREENHIQSQLVNSGVDMSKVDFFQYKTNDFWVRDNGPIFVYDQDDNLRILDWGFNGWGGDADYNFCDQIPVLLSSDLSIPLVDVSKVVLEGGALEIDGKGTMMATRSSVTQADRNPNFTEQEIEEYFTTYLGLENFIWLDGKSGEDITDMHIDGFVKFHDSATLVTMSDADLEYWGVSAKDRNSLANARNKNGDPYRHVILPLTQQNVTTSWGKKLGYKGSYVNYYIANKVVLVPQYKDAQDPVAIQLLEELYPQRRVVGIDCRNMYAEGGMIHCVTQQQPVEKIALGNIHQKQSRVNTFPNPCKETVFFQLQTPSHEPVSIRVFDLQGRQVRESFYNHHRQPPQTTTGVIGGRSK